MALRAAALARRGLAVLGNVSVLLVLVGLLWWGRQYKWKVPSLASLRGVAGADESAKVENASEDNATEVSPISSGNTGLKEEEPPLFQVRLRSKETVSKAGIRTAPVEERALAQYVTANGAIDYDQTEYAELSPRAAGTVWKVLNKAGDPVRKGEVLGLVAAPSVARAKAEFLQGILQVEVRTKILNRLKSGEDAIAVKQLREAEASVAEANLRLFDNQHTLINLGLPIDLEAMRKLKVDERVHRLRILGVPEAVLRDTDPTLLPTNLLPLVSPFDGEIIKRDMVLGEVVTTSQVQMIVADTRRLWIRLDVRQEDAEDVKIGQEVHFEPDVLGQQPAVELSISALPGLKQVRSLSQFGLSQVIVTFEDGTDIYFARQLINERLGTVQLPPNIDRPEMGPVATGLGEVPHYLVESDGLDLIDLRTYQNWKVRPRMRPTPGTAEINSWGGFEKQYQVRVDPLRLLKYDLGFHEVIRALRGNNLNVGGGNLVQTGEMLLIHGVGRTNTIEQIENIMIASREGTPIRVRDVAKVIVGHAIRRGAVTADGKGEAVLGLGFMLMGENSYKVTQRLSDKLEEVKKDAPVGARVETVYDRTESIEAIPVASATGERIPLSRLADVEVVQGPKIIFREWSKRYLTVQCNVRGRDMGGFVAEAREKIDAQVELPDGYHLEWGGQFENMERAQKRLAIVVPAALAMIVVLLYLTYHNLVDTLFVFASVPFACVGGVLTLWARAMPISVSAAVGFITLSGVSVLNGMILVSFLRNLLNEGVPAWTAVEKACRTCLRTVLMTALVASVGFIPMATSNGMGAEVQRPLATVVIGGVVTSTVFTLFVLPVLYLFGRGGVSRSAEFLQLQEASHLHGVEP